MPAATLAAAVERGQQLYRKHGCSACHGPQGHGDGSIAQSLQPQPRDFRQPDDFRFGYGIEQIANTIRDGVAGDRRVMPGYDYLSVSDRRALALLIRSLAEGQATTK
ncbi:MAG: cytochrome c [bacterium]|nr:cytochrome c [bacterium]